jgi:hypothetical protein
MPSHKEGHMARSIHGDLDCLIEIVDDKGDTVRELGRLSSLTAAIAAYDVLVQSWPRDRIMLRHRARIVRDSKGE